MIFYLFTSLLSGNWKYYQTEFLKLLQLFVW